MLDCRLQTFYVGVAHCPVCRDQVNVTTTGPVALGLWALEELWDANSSR